MEQIEQSIKEGALDLLKNDPTGFAEVLSFEAGSFQEDMPTSKEIEELTVDKVKVDLADFFDLLSGKWLSASLAAAPSYVCVRPRKSSAAAYAQPGHKLNWTVLLELQRYQNLP